jgi:DNA-binding LytR/AlgR family response regulator
MQVLLIEDEPHAVERLAKMVARLAPYATVHAPADSVAKAVGWLKNNPPPDLILMDIQLADGVSFDIFEQVPVSAPVIFITAYDEYALKAFKVNSIDYLLKPVDEEELRAAIVKLQTLRERPDQKSVIESISYAVQMLNKKYKEQFVVKVGEHLHVVEVQHILFFVSEEKVTIAQTRQNRKVILDFTLEQLENLLDPTRFFRINRKYIVALNSIHQMTTHANGRLRLTIQHCSDPDIVVARERLQEFKAWLDR